MAREDLQKLGYHDDAKRTPLPSLSDSRGNTAKREGFVAGLGGIERGKAA